MYTLFTLLHYCTVFMVFHFLTSLYMILENSGQKYDAQEYDNIENK